MSNNAIEFQNVNFYMNDFSEKELIDALWKYFSENEADRYSDKSITKENIMNYIKPHTVIINGNNSAYQNYGILCDCTWDEEHGISIILSENTIRIVSDIAELV